MKTTIAIYGGHDQCVAYAEDGIVKLAMEEERPTRVKHTNPAPSHAPHRSIEWLSDEGYDITEMDEIALADPVCNSSSINGTLHTMRLPLSLEEKSKRYEHHLCHTALAYAWSGWDDCYSLAIDGGGSISFGLAAHCKNGVIHEIARDQMENVQSIMNPGLLYLLITDALGFKMLSDEGKTTGLAAGGNRQRFAGLFDRYEVHPFEVVDRAMPGATRKDGTWHPSRQAIAEKIGCDPMDWSVRRDVAAAAQDFFEKMVFATLEAYIPRGSKIVLSGGCMANVTLNRRILDYASEVFVCPPMLDGGMAAGAAILSNGSIKSDYVEHVYLGYDTGEVKVDPHEVAKRVANGQVVGVCVGRCELGPRALGHRSILFDPRDPNTPTKVNHKLERDSFMPLAPSVLWEEALNVFEPAIERAMHTCEFMTMALRVNEKWQSLVPAVVHVDGTARPHLVRQEINPWYHEVLNEFYKLTGIPMIGNTSFNEHGEPIIYSAYEAVARMRSGCVDAVVIGNETSIKE